MSRASSPSCELKSSVKSAILNIEKQVQTIRKHQKYLESKLAEIANLLKKPENGKLMQILLFLFKYQSA